MPNALTEPPLYQTLTDWIREEINSGRISVGDKIPTEFQLCERHGVSRTTVRLAVESLVEEGVLQRQQGRGTFVTAMPVQRRQVVMSGKEFPESHEFSKISVLWCPATFEQATIFGIPADERIFALTRLWLDSGEAIALKSYYSPARLLSDSLPTDDEIEHAQFDKMLQERGIRIVAANIMAEPVVLHQREATLLGVESGNVALKLTRVGFDDDGRAVRISETLLKQSKAKLFWTERQSGTERRRDAPSLSPLMASALD